MKDLTTPAQAALVGRTSLLLAPTSSAATAAKWSINDTDVSGPSIDDVIGSKKGTFQNVTTTGLTSLPRQAAKSGEAGQWFCNGLIDNYEVLTAGQIVDPAPIPEPSSTVLNAPPSGSTTLHFAADSFQMNKAPVRR